ncbi:MAG: hypothetical protein NTY53_25725, partial [Kiritimatiellaeota bacterium]|nr:hypothetical protein [Kiritimatiellota bacterium]
MLGLLWAVPLRAADNTWTNGSGNWEVGANWLSGAPNSSQLFLYLTNDVTKTVQLLNIGPADVGTLAISKLVIGGASGTTNTVLVDAGLAANFQILKSLTINSGGAFVQNASTTTVTGASFFDGITVEGGSLAVGGGLLDASTSLLVLGSHVGGSQLVVTNGTLLNGTVYLGWWSGSSNNTALISGPAAIWRNDSLNVGLEGGGNRLTISNGGKAFTQSLIEGNGNGCGNTVEITGANSALISDYDVQVGYYSGNNRMTISAGG